MNIKVLIFSSLVLRVNSLRIGWLQQARPRIRIIPELITSRLLIVISKLYNLVIRHVSRARPQLALHELDVVPHFPQAVRILQQSVRQALALNQRQYARDDARDRAKDRDCDMVVAGCGTEDDEHGCNDELDDHATVDENIVDMAQIQCHSLLLDKRVIHRSLIFCVRGLSSQQF